MKKYLNSSIGRKQVVAATGLMLILFVVGHLAGNLTFFFGPKLFNAYAHKLAHLRPGLYLIEGGLLFVFLIHIYFTVLLVHDNIRSRPIDYEVKKSTEQRSLATRLMPLSGVIVFLFVIWHLIDFTFADKNGAQSYLGNAPINYELYGVVYNAFKNPLHSALYIIAMWAIGMHLSHGIESFSQTFGIKNLENALLIQRISNTAAVLVAGTFSLIPVYVLFFAPVY